MKWIVCSVFLLQIFQALGTRCITRNGERGTCMARNKCVGMLSHLLSNCANTGMICCPNTVPNIQVEPKFPQYCGETAMYPREQIVGGYKILPEEYSWIASLQYGAGDTFGACGGSVINALYVLTAAHCVEGEGVRRKGGLTGVRLGDFTQKPYCDYGSANCSSYKDFVIAETKVHENYHKDRAHNLHNDIALIRVDRKIQFGEVMKPVCLPFNIPEPDSGTILIVSGWGRTLNPADSEISKRAVGVPLWNETDCENEFRTVMCAGFVSKKFEEKRSSCDGDSGGPLMHNFARKKMAIEGIVSFSHGNCADNFFPSYFTRVREYLEWITINMYM